MKKFSNTEAELKKALLIKKRVPQKLVVKINQLSTPICGLLRTLCKSVILPHLNHPYEVSSDINDISLSNDLGPKRFLV